MEFLDYDGLKQYHGLLMNYIDQIEPEISGTTVPYSAFNSDEYSLKVGFDGDGKIELQVVKDLACKLNLSASTSYIWYGSSTNVTYTVSANDYTRGASTWSFYADGLAIADYEALDPDEQKSFTVTYPQVTSDISGTLTLPGASSPTTVTISCRKPIICTTSDIVSGSSYTDFSKNAGYANSNDVLNFVGYTPTTFDIYVGVPGDKTSIKFKSGTADNESPRASQVNININGVSVSYSIFKCSVIPHAEFKIYQ